MSFTAEIISVGTELLLGNVANTDAKDISEMLSELGINVFFHTVVGDNPQRLKDAVAIAKGRADIIITTGGLGPTYDDLTKQTLAEAFGKKLIFNKEEASAIEDYFNKYLHHAKMTDNNYQQAMLPEGCTVFHNECGTAPGCAFDADNIKVMMFPGPPKECVSMFKNCAMPYLKQLSDSEIHSHNIHIFGMGESEVEDKLRELMLKLDNPTLAPYCKNGEVMLRVTAKANSPEEAETLMKPVVDEVKSVIGPMIYGIDTESLEQTVLELLIKNNKTLSTAESCTGGLIAKRITDIPGASGAFAGSAVTYINEAKTKLLGVPPKLIEEKGVVSREVAMAMAKGIRDRLDTDIGIGVTGYAGPNADNDDTKVGTVFVALSADGQTFCRNLHLGFDRDRVRIAASNHALDMIRRYLTDLDPEQIV